MRDHDIVLFGATGFTGKLVAEYLVKQPGASRLAFGGRDRKKLEALAAELGASVPILVADSGDTAALARIAASTRVVCTTVGPYTRHGSALVAACVSAGTDYCDLTGELQFVRKMIDRHDAEARHKGARIVHCCGFDSIPSDLGTLLLESESRTRFGAPCTRVILSVRKLKGKASGGTVASILEIVREATRDPFVRKVLASAYSLNPEGERTGPDRGAAGGPAWNADIEAWTAPFVMGAINERVVRRSNALSDYSYGRDFTYREVMAFPRGAKGGALAVGMTAGIGAFFAAAAIPPLRVLLEKTVLPAPGEGPTREERESGFFEIWIDGAGEDPGGRRFRGRVTVSAAGDPGYAVTAKMLGESALCLAHDDRGSGGGILTPATAMGDRLLRRLRSAGMTFLFDAR